MVLHLHVYVHYRSHKYTDTHHESQITSSPTSGQNYFKKLFSHSSVTLYRKRHQMCVCVCVCQMCVCVCIDMQVHECVCMMRACAGVCVCVCVCVCVDVCTNVCVCVSASTCVCAGTYMFVSVFVCIGIHVRVCVYVYVYVCVAVVSNFTPGSQCCRQPQPQTERCFHQSGAPRETHTLNQWGVHFRAGKGLWWTRTWKE